MRYAWIAVIFLALVSCASNPERQAGVPQFKVDPFWPKPLPSNWILGQVAGIAVAKDDTIWLVHRPSSLLDDEKLGQKSPPESKCCVAAPPVLQFDAAGNLLRSWGGKGAGYDWFENEHGIYVDGEGHVWVGGNSPKDHHIVQFTAEGKFIKQLGKPGKSDGSNATSQQLGRPAHMVIDGGELFVADGYGNRRIAVFDARTLAYKRHWGGYGERPHDDKLPPYDPRVAISRSFLNPVHCVRVANDGQVYVCDRNNDRIQVFEKSGKFVREMRVEPQTMGSGSVADLVFSEDRGQKYMFIADITNNRLHVVERESGRLVSSFSQPGRMAGELKNVHNIAIDSKGNLYTAEVGSGRRAQKFVRQ
jgi:hypothetical protein